jgi:hypothetical protein
MDEHLAAAMRGRKIEFRDPDSRPYQVVRRLGEPPRRLWAAAHGSPKESVPLGTSADGAKPNIRAAVQSTGGRPGPRVLLVGTFDGRAGQHQTIQSAVNAARPGD